MAYRWINVAIANNFALDYIRIIEYMNNNACLWGFVMPENLRRLKASIFQALAHPTRIAMVELLRDEGEVPVSTIHERLGLEQANASQHLAVLRSRRIVVGRKDGNQVFYSLRDRILGKVLNLMKQYFETHLQEALELLKDIKTEEHASR